MISGKRGRKCSMKHCDNYQHTHKNLSFFRFPKDIERCKVWIERAERPDLLSKVNVHEERICQLHFDTAMFANEHKNRLIPSAVPTSHLSNGFPPLNNTTINGFPLSLLNDDNLAIMRKAELLYQAQLAAENNLTITPVYSKKISSNGATVSPLNLSAASLNYSQSSNGSLHNTTDPMNGLLSDLTVTTSPISAPTNDVKVLKASNSNGNSGGNRRPRQVFTLEQEEQLAVYVRDTANYYSGLSAKEVRIMAFVYGVCNMVDMPAAWRDNHQASFDWCVGFIKRNKLPSTLITGISGKGSKSSKSNVSSSLPVTSSTMPKTENIPEKLPGNIVNAIPIEID